MTVRPLVSAATALAAATLAVVTVAACSSSGSSSSTGAVAGLSTTTSTTTTLPSQPGKGKPAVVIGDKNYTEQFVLGELYSEALQAEGFSVSLNPNIGSSQVTMAALQKGDLDMYPEYLNVWNAQIAGDARHFTTLRGAYRAAKRYAAAQGLELLNPTPFSDTSGIGVTASFAQQNHLETIKELDDVPTTLTLGGPPQFRSDSTSGLPAIEQAYGFIPDAYKSVEIGNQYKALDQDTIQAAYVNTTDGELTTGNYVLLKDPKAVFGIGNVVPVVTAKTLQAEGPAFAETINRVTALLTDPVIRQLNALVDLAGEAPAGVASRFLADHGLIPPSTVITS